MNASKCLSINEVLALGSFVEGVVDLDLVPAPKRELQYVAWGGKCYEYVWVCVCVYVRKCVNCGCFTLWRCC